MTITALQWCLDAGTLILIWLVQLIIYPSFLYVEDSSLQKWHQQYTVRISWVVIPLMLGQLALGFWSVYENLNWGTGFRLGLILAIWMVTFSHFVPAHQKIGAGINSKDNIHFIGKFNWIRTLLWSFLFLSNFIG